MSPVYADHPACQTDCTNATTSTAVSDNADCNNPSPTATTLNNCVKHDQIVTDLNVIVNILSALVGVVVTGVIVLGGVQYSIAGDSPDAVSKAKQRITNGLLALVIFILTYAFLQWIIPGGVFS